MTPHRSSFWKKYKKKFCCEGGSTQDKEQDYIHKLMQDACSTQARRHPDLLFIFLGEMPEERE
jgi:hypothetical protein